MEKLFKTLLTTCLLLLSGSLFSQDTSVEMADGMRSEGKIYVVVAIILIVLFGLIAYLFLMDRKLTRIEKLVEKRQTKS